MNYAGIYENLIERARFRELVTYTERHHIIPRCVGGGNEASNIVRLTPEEHFLAHQLLVKIHPDKRVLIFALNCMIRSVKDRRANNKLFGWMRRLVGKAMSDQKRGKPRSPEVRAKLSAANKGKFASKETLAKMSASRKGKKHSAAHSAAISLSLMGNKPSDKARREFKAMLAARTPEQISAAARKSWETRRKSGKLHPLVGRKMPEAQKSKIRASCMGNTHSEEAKGKMRKAALIREKRKREARATCR